MINLEKNKEIGTQKLDESKVNPFVSQLDKCHTRQIQKKKRSLQIANSQVYNAYIRNIKW